MAEAITAQDKQTLQAMQHSLVRRNSRGQQSPQLEPGLAKGDLEKR